MLRVIVLRKAENGEEPVIETESSWIVAVVSLTRIKLESVIPITRTTPSDGVRETAPHVKAPLVAIRFPVEMLQRSVIASTSTRLCRAQKILNDFEQFQSGDRIALKSFERFYESRSGFSESKFEDFNCGTAHLKRLLRAARRRVLRAAECDDVSHNPYWIERRSERSVDSNTHLPEVHRLRPSCIRRMIDRAERARTLPLSSECSSRGHYFSIDIWS
jgi:hypothetical protein